MIDISKLNYKVKSLTSVGLLLFATSDGLGTRYYFSNFEYGNNMQLAFIHTSEGRVRNDGGNFKYDYYLKDHLGNTRVVFTEENGAAKELQVSNYYPFGMRFNQSNTYDIAGKTSQYMYNGKELQEDFDLDWMDYGARMYDPALARWNVVDPLAEWHFNVTPYHYAMNNPINYIDVMGMDTTTTTDSDGNPNFNLDEIPVNADKPVSKWKRFWNKVGSALKKGDNALKNPTSAPVEDSNWEDDFILEHFDQSEINKAKDGFRSGNIPITPVKSDAQYIDEDRVNSTSDKDIVETTTGPSEKRTANGAQSTTEAEGYKPQESDSAVATYPVMFDEGGNHTYRDKKIHKGTLKGRWVSNPYKKK